ncbi:thioredoxin [Calocera cornea HHB12733]|uniref:Thioredoxin n=1 Tax=Calocera cornea HHB12733 TaxID=1353952 RepID=A0A165K5C6_9BASI|nr:thioredoxin [Calocera cornea HHB12733]
MVKPIESYEEFKTLLNSNRTFVVDYWATWCGPCRRISPIFEELSHKFTDLEFYKVDVDEQEEISKESGITAMPTFILFKNGQKIDYVRGANPPALEALVSKAV